MVLLRSLVYRVEQLFLIHRETGLCLLHVAADPAAAQDSEMVAGMLTAIRDFSRDSLAAGKDATLEEFRVGELQGWIAPGPHAYLAAAIRGNPPREVHAALEDAIDNVHILKGSALAQFAGDTAVFESLRPELEACMRSQYKKESAENQRHTKAWLAIAVSAGAVAAACIVALRSEGRWQDFLGRLKREPGIAITTARKAGSPLRASPGSAILSPPIRGRSRGGPASIPRGFNSSGRTIWRSTRRGCGGVSSSVSACLPART